VTRRELGGKCKQISETRFRTTYKVSAVALKNAGVDLDLCAISINSTALEVACPPPGIEAKKVEEISENTL
jgi:hypothetical protein